VSSFHCSFLTTAHKSKWRMHAICDLHGTPLDFPPMSEAKNLNICFATSECVPFVKTGGLADVSGALPKALAASGCDVRVFLPFYKSINAYNHGLTQVDDLKDIQVSVGAQQVRFSVWLGKFPDGGHEVPIYLIDCPKYFHRDNPYTNDADEDERFILFQIAIIHVLQRLKWSPDIMHCNDWQTSLLPVLMKTTYVWDKLFEGTKSLLTIHNIGYQGRFAKEAVHKAGLSYDHFKPGGAYEMDGAFCFLKAGILHSEFINAVSPTYAQEIQTAEYGAGMEGVLATRKNDVYGILNGIDTDHWSPAVDSLIPFTYSTEDPAGKRENKKALLQEVGLPYDEKHAVIGIVSRFAGQKGFELLQPIIHQIMQLPVQVVALGSGDNRLEKFFRDAAQAYPGKVFAYLGYNNDLAHLITAGADIFLMPSMYEPCGLNQMYSLNYGTVPIVRKTGGLADTVRDYHEFNGNGNGFSFEDPSAKALFETILRAVTLFSQRDIWEAIMRQGMEQDFSWDQSARRYVELYQKALNR
jgi:starch synthase